MQNFIVQEKTPLLVFLRQELKGYKNKTIKQYLQYGSVFVNGNCIRKHDHLLQPQDQVKILDIRHAQEFSAFKIKILYEDPYFVVIDKPADLLSIPGHGDPQKNALYQTTEILKTRGSLRTNQLFAAHRLDLGTSGTLLFTKNKFILQHFWDHWTSVHKDYLAIVKGHPNPPENTITLPLKEAPDQKVLVDYSLDSCKAITKYKTLRTAGEYALLEVDLVTGYKHQIRVHLAEKKYPILGDRKYGQEAQTFPRLALHAWKLSFSHPKTQQLIHVESLCPPLFQEFLDQASNQEKKESANS